MGNKLREVIYFILSQKDRGILKTQLIKLLFLVDLEFYRQRKETLTGLTYKLYLYGPYPPEIEKVLFKMEMQGYITLDERISVSGKRYILYFAGDEEVQLSLTQDEISLIESVLDKYGDKDLKELLSDVYSLDVVKAHNFGDILIPDVAGKA